MNIQTILAAAFDSNSARLLKNDVQLVQTEHGHLMYGPEAAQVYHARALVKEYNKNRPEGHHALRIALQGRLGKNNPNAHKYRGQAVTRIHLSDAQSAGVYVWTRTEQELTSHVTFEILYRNRPYGVILPAYCWII